MSKIPSNYLDRLYSGWLAKIIGIRLGAPIEGWTYEKIKNTYGDLDHYPVDYNDFAADDDSNGPLFFLRALKDLKPGNELTAQDVGEALLNYAPYEHGFFWWGGYGISTEHTAYLNLYHGIKAPRSGSIEQNGSTVAEQIGGQIFIDTWGLVAPGNPDLAAKYAREAASVTHDGNGIYGGIFIATCISAAFIEQDIMKIIETGLSYIPADSEYTRVTRAVIKFHQEHPENWRDCFEYIFNNFGYDKYPGACHIIPNSAVMVLSLLYGEGDFDRTINICNLCGWDTDCTVGNIATIMGVRNGIEDINYEKWIKPVHDLLICSSVIGSLNIMDIPYGASFIAALAYHVAGEEPPAMWKELFENRMDSCHFEYPESTHSLRARSTGDRKLTATLRNSEEFAHTGKRSLKVHARPLFDEDALYLYKKTHYTPKDFDDSRYDPCFSPLLYAGQTVHGSVYLPEYSVSAYVRMYAREQRTGEEFLGERVKVEKGQWVELSAQIPAKPGALLDEAGFRFEPDVSWSYRGSDFIAFVDDLYFDGKADYSVDFANETTEVWNFMHKEISQFTRLKGLAYLEDGLLNLSGPDFAEVYTGHHDWTDYTTEFKLIPGVGDEHYGNVRVQGAIRSYSVGLSGQGKFAILKNDNGYSPLKVADFDWKNGEEYTVTVKVSGNEITATVADVTIKAVDDNFPYLTGSVGLSVRNGSHCRYKAIAVKP